MPPPAAKPQGVIGKRRTEQCDLEAKGQSVADSGGENRKIEKKNINFKKKDL